jgi:uncharacterized membrane protein
MILQGIGLCACFDIGALLENIIRIPHLTTTAGTLTSMHNLTHKLPIQPLKQSHTSRAHTYTCVTIQLQVEIKVLRELSDQQPPLWFWG